MTAARIHVAGATGGVGTTVLSAALAARSAARGHRTVVVERSRGGLDVVLAVDAWPGVRLDDLAEVDGHLDGHRLTASLPRSVDVGVLAYSAERPGGALGPAVREAVDDALASACDVLVVDAGRDAAGADVLVAGSAAHQLARARALARPGMLLALADGGLDAQELAQRLGMRDGVAVRPDRAVDRALVGGVVPGASGRGIGAAADRLLDALGLGPVAAR